MSTVVRSSTLNEACLYSSGMGVAPEDAGNLQRIARHAMILSTACSDSRWWKTCKICSAALHGAAIDGKPCLKSDLPSPAGVEMAVAVGLTVVAAWTAIKGMQLMYSRSIYWGAFNLSMLGCTAQQSQTHRQDDTMPLTLAECLL